MMEGFFNYMDEIDTKLKIIKRNRDR